MEKHLQWDGWDGISLGMYIDDIPWRIHGAAIYANKKLGIVMGSMAHHIWQHHGSYGYVLFWDLIM